MQPDAEAKIQELKASILRTVNMAIEDSEKPSCDKQFLSEVVRYALWFEEKYKFRFRNAYNHLIVKKGEIYYCNFGRNIGSEQDEYRPAIILQNDAGNVFSSTTIVAPITKEEKSDLPTHIDLKDLKPQCQAYGKILIEQLRCVSKNRLGRKLDSIDVQSSNWGKVNEAIMVEFDVISHEKNQISR